MLKRPHYIAVGVVVVLALLVLNLPGRATARLKLFQWEQQHRWKSRLKLAHVITRDPANWWRTVQIDLGSRDGLRTNLTVLTTEGLVGRVHSVGFTRSQVVLVGDPNCKV